MWPLWLTRKMAPLLAMLTIDLGVSVLALVGLVPERSAALLNAITAVGMLVLALRGEQARRHAQREVSRVTPELAHLDQVMRQTADGVVITDLDGRITWANDGFERLTGYPAAEALGHKPGDLLQFEGTDPLTVTRIREALRKGVPITCEILNRTKEGREYWVELKLQPSRTPDGVHNGFMALQLDITARKLADAALRAGQALLDRTGQIGGVGGWEVDLRTGRMRWTEQTCRILGHDTEYQPMLEDGLRHCAPEARQKVEEAIKAGLSAGTSWDMELPFVTTAGQKIWVRAAAECEFDDEGPVRLVGALQDITERRRAEATQHATRALLDRTGQIGGVGGWEVDLLSGQVRWTDQTCRILGRELGFEPSLRDCLDHCAAEARLVIETAISEGLQDNTSWDYELPFITSQGEPIWARISAECEFNDHGPVRIVGALQDITAFREIQADNQRNTELLYAAIETIDEAFVLYDPQDGLVYCNEKYRAVYETSRDLMVPGTPFETILRGGVLRSQYPEASGDAEEWVQQRLAEHRAGNHTLIQHMNNGRVVRVVERRMADGHHVGFHVDITDLVRATEAAQKADRTKTEFIATISHELRTPLQSILGFSELGRHFAEGHPQYEPMFTDIHAGGKRMLRLVNGLLDVTKMDGAQGSLHSLRCDLGRLAREVVTEVGVLAGERDVSVKLVDPVAALPVEVDPFRIQQVIRNVLANAIRFSPEGGRIEVSGARRDGGITLTVRDHGPGIPADELDTIFEAFVQSSRTRDGSGGSGLGLTICRKIMKAHGGHITATNADDGHGGAEIRLWLPEDAPIALPPATDEDEVAPSQGPAHTACAPSIDTAFQPAIAD